MKNLSQSEFTFNRDLSILYDDLLYCKCENGEVTIADYDIECNRQRKEEYKMTFECKTLPKEVLEKNNYKLEYTEINVITPKAVNLSLPHVELEAPHEVWIPLSVLSNHNEEDKTVYVWDVFADEHLEGFIQ